MSYVGIFQKQKFYNKSLKMLEKLYAGKNGHLRIFLNSYFLTNFWAALKMTTPKRVLIHFWVLKSGRIIGWSVDGTSVEKTFLG